MIIDLILTSRIAKARRNDAVTMIPRLTSQLHGK